MTAILCALNGCLESGLGLVLAGVGPGPAPGRATTVPSGTVEEEHTGEGPVCYTMMTTTVVRGSTTLTASPTRPPAVNHRAVAWSVMAETQLTRDTFDRLHAELEDLRTRGRVDIARAIEAARALGDLKENGDYHAAKDSQGKMEARIRQLEAMLEGATIVDAGSAAASDEVTTGAVVSLRYVGDDDVERYLIGSIEERREGVSVISPNSPLGLALLGRRAGEKVGYEAPSGELEVEIVGIGS
jgi:transcription elongation factor GreA